jgi:hypothetical protein
MAKKKTDIKHGVNDVTGNPAKDLGQDRKDEFWERTSDDVANGYGAQIQTNNSGGTTHERGRNRKGEDGRNIDPLDEGLVDR